MAIFLSSSIISLFFFPLVETAGYGLKYCFKGPFIGNFLLKYGENKNEGQLVVLGSKPKSTNQTSFVFYYGWLFWVSRPFETVFQSKSGRLPERGRKKREMIDERKIFKQPPPASTASAVSPCPTMIQISRTPRLWKFTQHHRTTRPPPYFIMILVLKLLSDH